MGLFGLFSKSNNTSKLHSTTVDKARVEELVAKHREPFVLALKNADPQIRQCHDAIADVFEVNYKSIFLYLAEAYQGKRKDDLMSYTNQSILLAIQGGWSIGREWIVNNTQLRAEYIYKTTLESKAIPSDAMQLLNVCVSLPYQVFHTVFENYYNSSIGKKVRGQKESHLIDTYQTLENVVIQVFLVGIKS